MDKNTLIVLAAGLLLTILLAFVNIYLGGIALIITIVIVMSLLIMKDTLGIPTLEITLKDDAKGIVVRNAGNAPAVNINLSLVPMDIEYRLPFLAVDESHEFRQDGMIRDVKVVAGFENEDGAAFTHTVKLSSYGEEFEPLKPVIPLFKWK
jgi:hypothetical protein